MNQQQPTPGKEGMTQLVIADLLEREKRGIAKYGRTLETFNGRNALQDAYEEALDLAQYLKQGIMEQKDVGHLVEDMKIAQIAICYRYCSCDTHAPKKLHDKICQRAHSATIPWREQ